MKKITQALLVEESHKHYCPFLSHKSGLYKHPRIKTESGRQVIIRSELADTLQNPSRKPQFK